jgi:archaemetzincin
MVRVCLATVGTLEPGLAAAVGRGLAAALPCELLDEGFAVDPGFAFDARRQQFWSTPILAKLEAARPANADAVLGITEVDLFIPILTFVFGEALLSRPPALISLHRLRPSFYGLPENPDLLVERAQREAVHELGHVLGLVHCHDYGCIMHASRAAEEIDLKGPGFCPRCAADLPTRTGRPP